MCIKSSLFKHKNPISTSDIGYFYKIKLTRGVSNSLNGAGDENRTHVRSLEGSYSTIKLHLHWLHVKDYIT